MSYDPNWENPSSGQRVVARQNNVMLCDVREFAPAINRRRLLMYLSQGGYYGRSAAGEFIRVDPLVACSPNGDSGIRDGIASLIDLQSGMSGVTPSAEWAYNWLWPVADSDENKIIGYQDDGQFVNIFARLNDGTGLTDSGAGVGSYIRAAHVNEMRQMIEWLRRGRMLSKIHLPIGIVSMYPDEPWVGGLLGNTGDDELLTIGYANLCDAADPAHGLANVNCLASSRITITAEYNCTVEAYHYTRPIDMSQYDHTWNSLGGGLCDAVLLGSATLQAGVAGNVSGQAVSNALNAIASGGGPAYFLLRRSDPSYETMYVQATVTAEFDLNSPPN